ncbi:restriction endonuclease subunit S [Bacillus safensis]|uniref:restriction endonuclease subunit S n=1 Tax=Bacillus safensis TaxID=561879 RepID=UPI001F2D803F|nr:restriction endonuclease subunit S [Bacillus safensis]UIN52101.1 restriction endonuclease subunit S [Bacillus safensis]
MVKRVKSYSLSRDVETPKNTGFQYIHYGDIHKKVANIIDLKSNLPNIQPGNYELLKTGDLILADASEDYQGIATPAIVYEDLPYKLVAGLHTIALRPESKRVDSLFLYYLINSQVFRKHGYRVGSGMKVFGISATNILKFEYVYPTIVEQTQIGNFFKQLDETIAFQQQELDTLKQTKQGFLQKMFPKEGESLPEIRFPGFSGEWEAKCLGEISESYSGGTPSVDNKTFYGGDIPFIRSAEINSKTTEIYITEEGFNSSSTKMVRVGDILYALYGATSGEVGISKINGAINQAVLAIKPKRGYDSYFLIQWLKNQKSSIINTYLQGGQGNLSGSIVKKLILKIPFDEKEQTEIGHFFKQLDETIALHEQELDILKQTKKAFLQKMFV